MNLEEFIFGRKHSENLMVRLGLILNKTQRIFIKDLLDQYVDFKLTVRKKKLGFIQGLFTEFQDWIFSFD